MVNKIGTGGLCLIGLCLCLVHFLTINAMADSISNKNDMHELNLRFREAMAESNSETALLLLNSLILDAEINGIVHGPSHFVRALRTRESNDSEIYEKDIFKALDEEIIGASFLLADMQKKNLDNLLKSKYYSKSIKYLRKLAESQGWLAPFSIKILINNFEVTKNSKGPGLYFEYSRAALEAGSPTTSALVLFSGDWSGRDRQEICQAIIAVGSVRPELNCDLNFFTKDQTKSAKLEAYKRAVESVSFGKFEIYKKKFCSDLVENMQNSLVCYDAIANIFALCFLRSDNKTYSSLEGLFICSEKDAKWLNQLTAEILESALVNKVLDKAPQ